MKARFCSIIESLGVYLPPNRLSTMDVLRGCKRRVQIPLEELTGIKYRRVAGNMQFSIDLAREAVTRCLARSRYAAEEIDILIACNICRCDGPNLQFSIEPNTSSRLAKELGFTNAITFDLSNACTGMFTSINVADALIASGTARNALIVSGEYISHIATTAQMEIESISDPRLACLTLGDAGAAIILERSSSPDVGFHDLEIYTLAAHSGLCVAQLTRKGHGGAIMLTDAVKLSVITLQQAIPHSLYVLERNDWLPQNVDHLIMHQTARTTLHQAVREIEKAVGGTVPSVKVVDNLSNRGNTATTSHFVALSDQIETGEINSGESVLFSTTGSGVNIGTALYTFDDLPDRIRQHNYIPDTRKRRQCFPQVDVPAKKIRVESIGLLGFAGEARDGLEWARTASMNCLALSRHAVNEIDLIIYSGVYGRSDAIFEPAIAALVAGKLRMNDNASPTSNRKSLGFDIFNGGVGSLTACQVATAMINRGDHACAMIVASEIDHQFRTDVGVLLADRGELRIADTASALILEPCEDGDTGFGTFLFRNFPEYAGAFVVDTVQKGGESYLRCRTFDDLKSLYLRCIPAVVRELLAIERISLADVTFVLGPQLGGSFCWRLGVELGLPQSCIVNIADENDDLFTSSFAYCMDYVRRRGMARAGDLGLIIVATAGIQIGCVPYRF
jgi:3-oxoacyl-[acyl-carrier-protein] synthase III